MNRNWTEEEIAALVDGSLEGEDQAAHLRQILNSDPEAQAYANQLRALNDSLARAFAEPMHEPVPSAIQAAIDGPPVVVQIGQAEQARQRKATRQPWIPMAMAASIALVVGLNFDRLFGDTEQGGPTTVGLVPTESSLHLALETLASGSGTEDGIYPVLSFRDGAGRPCREFETTNELVDELLFGIACRTEAERWDVQIVVTAPKGEGTQPGYAPASGPAADILETVLDTLEAGPTLTPAVEAELLESGWTPASVR